MDLTAVIFPPILVTNIQCQLLYCTIDTSSFQKNLQTLSDLEKLKEHYYQEYMEALRSKIDKQKQKIKKKEDILTKKINKREEKKVRIVYESAVTCAKRLASDAVTHFPYSISKRVFVVTRPMMLFLNQKKIR